MSPAAPPRLVATDLDGTLLDADGRVGERTREVLLELDRRGVPVVFVTGRPLRWMEDLWADVGGHGLAICSNGAIVYDVGAGAVRTAHGLTGEVLHEVAELLRERLPGTVVAMETVEGFARESAWEGHDGRTAPDAVRVVDDLRGFGTDGPATVKLLARLDGADPEDFWRRATEVVGDLATVTWSSRFAMVEISAAGVTKASTLAGLCADLGVDAADVIAFGDMPNDLPMLAWAGRGCAMAGAHPTVREAADEVVGDHDEDGVAAALASVFGLAGWPA